MKTTFCIVAAAALLAGCSKPAAPAPAAVQAGWEYVEFNFQGDRDLRDISFDNFIQFYDGSAPESNSVKTISQVLNQAGRFGWDLASKDGSNFIMKRPLGMGTNGHFFVGQTLTTRPR